MQPCHHSTSVYQKVQKQHVYKRTYGLFVLSRYTSQIYLCNTFNKDICDIAKLQLHYTENNEKKQEGRKHICKSVSMCVVHNGGA